MTAGGRAAAPSNGANPVGGNPVGGNSGGAKIVWLRRDLRLTDHPALSAAIEAGGPVVPVFILDPVIVQSYGAAAKWRLSRSLAALASDLEDRGSRLILRKGPALDVLQSLARETGASTVYWSRLYDPAAIERDKAVKAGLRDAGLNAESFDGWLLVEPFRVATKAGDFFKVYTPFWRAVSALPAPPQPLPAPSRAPAPDAWPESVSLEALGLERAMDRGGAVVARYAAIGERAARERLDWFLETTAARYGTDRDRLDLDGTSRLSAHFATGELSPRTAWHAAAAKRAADPEADASVEIFQKEIVWREFAWHLLYHTPHIAERSWRAQWDGFPWREDNDEAERWRRGQTGIPVIDAAMREIYVTGVMHNRARMLVGSYLTKNLLTDWRVGEAWFRDCLVDWDPASNAMGWQWVAGSGPDAAPYFRIFNPETQAQKFDPDGAYVRRWLPEAGAGGLLGANGAHNGDAGDGAAFFEACPRSWNMAPDAPYPKPNLSLSDGRARALDAYAAISKAKS